MDIRKKCSEVWKYTEDIHVFSSAIVYDHDNEPDNTEQVVLRRTILLLSWRQRKEEVENILQQWVKVKSHGRIERNFIAGRKK
jgi:hypothetical protein